MRRRLRQICWGVALYVSFSPLSAATFEQKLKHAQHIDSLVQEQLSAESLAAPEVVQDHLFLRRSFLTVIGRIPTPAEAQQFHDLGSQERRQELIQYLYQHEGYSSHTANWAMDLLRLKDRNNKNYHAQVLLHWVRDALASDMPWDKFARELVTAKGNAWVDNPAAGYYAMDPGMQNDNLANTAFAFLGVKLECAQCHDDPFQEWERLDFYQLSAFVNGESLLRHRPRGNIRQIASAEPDKYLVAGFGRLDQLEQEIRYYLNFGTPNEKGKELVKLPTDWQYEDATPGELVYARTPFGEKVKSELKHPNMPLPPSLDHLKELPKHERRAAFLKLKSAHKTAMKSYKLNRELARKGTGDGLDVFGDWLVSDETPQFAQTIANRLWDRVMGFSLTEDLGIYVEADESEFPELIAYLSTLMKSYDYNIRDFQETLALTMTFQSESTAQSTHNGNVHSLTGRRIKRMTAEQIWDSLLSLIVPDPDALAKRQLPTDLIYKRYNIGKIDEVVNKVRAMTPEEYLVYIQELYREIVEGKYEMVNKRRGYRGQMEMEAMTEMEGEMDKSMIKGAQQDLKSIAKNLKRASEVPSPVPPGHFLATFGQSDRIAIDGSTQEGSVSQALLMYNGVVQQYIVSNRASALRLKLHTIEDPTERICTIFYTTLTRYPTETELAACLQEVQETGKNAYLNILSALICSQEFLFIT